jgi:hypothetical protein
MKVRNKEEEGNLKGSGETEIREVNEGEKDWEWGATGKQRRSMEMKRRWGNEEKLEKWRKKGGVEW